MIDYRLFHETHPSLLPSEYLPSLAVTSGRVGAST